MKFNLLSYNWNHITDESWNHTFEEFDINLHIKYGYPENENDLIVVTDFYIFDYDKKYKNAVAWIVESPAILIHDDPNFFKRLVSVENDFPIILTHNKKLIESSPKYKFFPYNDAWVKYNQFTNKSKLISMILSSKVYVEGHRFRYDIYKNLPIDVDVFGKTINPIDDKTTGLNDYYFSIAMENCKEDYYYTEKLLDCFKTKTLPIYWGCPSIGNFFDINGIITFDTKDELYSILNNLTIEDYYLRLKAIENNYKIVSEINTFFKYFNNITIQ